MLHDDDVMVVCLSVGVYLFVRLMTSLCDAINEPEFEFTMHITYVFYLVVFTKFSNADDSHLCSFI